MQILIVSSGVFLSALDVSVNVALPKISSYFNSPPNVVYLMIVFYLSTTVALQLPLGKAGDIIGLRKVFVFGLLAYTLSMIAIGLAPSIGTVIIFRSFQAFGNASLLAIAPALVTSMVTPEIRGRSLGIMTSIGSVGMITGTLFAGLTLEYFSWEWIFLGRVPLCLIALIGSLTLLKGIGVQQKSNLLKENTYDWLGAFLLFLGLISLVTIFQRGSSQGYLRAEIVLLLVIFLAAVKLFIFRQKTTDNPLIDLELTKNTVLVSGFLSNLFFFMGSFINFFILPYYVGTILESPDLVLAMFLFINALAIFIFAPIGGYVSDKIGSPIVSLIGLSIVSCTLLTYLSLDGDSNTFEIAIRIGFVGLGTGLFQSSNLNLVMGTIKVREFGSGGAISSISRGLGCVASVTLLGGAFTSLYESTVSDVDILDALSSPNSVDAFIFSYHVSYVIGAAIVGLSIVFTMIAWRSMKKSESRIDYKHIDCNNLKTNRKEL